MQIRFSPQWTPEKLLNQLLLVPTTARLKNHTPVPLPRSSIPRVLGKESLKHIGSKDPSPRVRVVVDVVAGDEVSEMHVGMAAVRSFWGSDMRQIFDQVVVEICDVEIKQILV